MSLIFSKNTKIKPLNLYIVTSPIGNLFMNKKYNLVYGKFLINFKDIEILFYKEPANIISVNFKEIVDELYEKNN